MRRHIIAAIFLALLASAVSAAPVGGIAITGARVLQCVGNVIEGAFVPAAFDDSGQPVATFSATQYYAASNGGSAVQSAALTSGSSHAFYLAVGTGSVAYVDVSLVSDEDPAVRSGTVRIYCDGRVEYLATGSGSDGRLNFANGDLINVLYLSTGSDGRSGISVYSLDGESNGVFEGRFDQDLFAPYLETPPAENTYLAQIDASQLYALTTGEFQIVIGDPVEAKTYTTVFSAFDSASAYAAP